MTPRVINTSVGVQAAFLCMVSATPEDWWTEHCPWETHMLRLLMQGLLPRVFLLVLLEQRGILLAM